MSTLIRLLRLLWQALLIGPYLAGCYLFWLIRYSNNPSKYPIEKRYRKLRRLIHFLFWTFRVRVNVSGLDNLRNIEGRFLITPNHRSVVDAITLIYISEKPITFAAKIESKKYPVIGRAITMLEGVFLDRDDLRQQLKMMKYIDNETKNNPNRNWVIFPEGTRNKDDSPFSLLEFHQGSFRTVVSEQIPVIPCVMYGNDRILSKKYRWNIHVQADFGKPIYPGEASGILSTNTFAERDKEAMLVALEDIVLRDKEYNTNLLKAKKKQLRIENELEKANNKKSRKS